MTQFVLNYQLQTKMARVGLTIVDFSTHALSRHFSLSESGRKPEELDDLKKEVEVIFEQKLKGGKDTKWNHSSARQHWKMWPKLINIYLLFRSEEMKMEQKYVVVAIRTWEGVEVNWALIVQQRLNEKI